MHGAFYLHLDMIDQKELRIGNLVLYKPYGNKDGELKTVCGILGMIVYFNKHTNQTGMTHNLQPIPLTSEILEQCGFKDITEGYRATGSEGGTWRIASPLRGQYIDLYEEYKFGEGIIGYFLGHFEYTMKYLHQLQNLYFALTGTELTVKLIPSTAH